MSYHLLPRDPSSPIPPPITTPLPSTGRRRSLLAFFGTAAATGFLFHIILLGLGAVPTNNHAVGPKIKDWWHGSGVGPASPPSNTTYGEHSERPSDKCPSTTNGTLIDLPSYLRPGLGQYVVAGENEWTMDRIRKMVEGTKGYYARDYSLGLGWNNMRYIVEAGLLHANLLNRTLVLPSFVYARACEWNITVCASFAHMVNRGDAVGWNEWRELPIEQQMGWRIPIEIMLDLRHLRKYASVVTIAEYLTLHGLQPSLEQANGAWHREFYHSSSGPSLAVIRNHEYDPSGVVRVDKMPPAPKRTISTTSVVYKKLIALRGEQLAVKLDDVKGPLKKIAAWNNEKELETIIEDHGFVVLHTFAGALGMDYLKSVVEPIKQIAPRSALKGLIDDYDSETADVLLLEGEIHLGRKPGSLRFTSIPGRQRFANLVLHGLIHIPPIEALADRVAERMLKLNEGRMWMAGHMRRGDFVRLHWAMEGSVEAHFGRIKERLHKGAAKIRQMVKSGEPFQIADIPFVKPDKTFVGREPPRDDDKFYLATDERSPEGVKYVRSQGAVLIGDLIFPEDRRLIGWPLLYTDVVALLEQSIMAHSVYFYAHAMSSVAGGVVNMRAARGLDPRLTLID